MDSKKQKVKLDDYDESICQIQIKNPFLKVKSTPV